MMVKETYGKPSTFPKNFNQQLKASESCHANEFAATI